MKEKFSLKFGRTLLIVSAISLLGAWLSQLTQSTILGMTQEHLFNDTIATALLGIGLIIDSMIHGQKKE